MLAPPTTEGLRTRVSEELRAQQRNLYIASYNELIAHRIVRTYGAGGAFDYHDRSRASSVLSGVLDAEGLAVFGRELNQLTADPKVQTFLSDVRAKVAAATPERPARLWDIALAHAGSRDEAIRWLAVLFQDYSPRALEDGGSVAAVRDTATREGLRQTIVAIADATGKGTLAPFPAGADCDGANFYHYYVPAYLAQRMVQQGVTPDLAFLSAATFNLEYEIWRPALIVGRQKKAVAALTPVVTEAFGAPLETKVRELRAAGRVDSTFTVADLDLVADLHLSPAKVREVLAAVDRENGLVPEAKAVLAQSRELTMNTIAEVVSASDSSALAQSMRSKSWLSVTGNVFSSRDVIADYIANGARDPIPLSDDDARGAYAGFAGASIVLPEGRPPLPRQQLMEKVLADPTGTMRSLFAPRLGSPPQQDATYADLAAKLGRTNAEAAVAVVDPSFDTNVPSGGWDFIDNDDNPTSRSLFGAHGTPVVGLVQRGTSGIVAIPLRANLGQILAAIEYASERGAKCVVISQDMVADTAAGQQAFRDILRRHPELVVIVASGNSGKPLGSRSYELAAVHEPNLVVVAAATASRRVSPISNFGPEHVRFAMRGGTMEPQLWKDAFVTRLGNRVQRVIAPDAEASSHAAPAFGNLFMKVKLLAPELSADEALRVIAATAHSDDATRSRVRDGIPDYQRAERLAALMSLVRQGATPQAAAARLGLSRDAIDDYSRFQRGAS